MADNKTVLGYDKFLMMALRKGGSLSLDELWEKSILFLSLIWYQQLPEKGQPLTERLFFTISHMRSKLEDGMTKEASQGTKEEMDKLINDGWVKLNDNNKYELTLSFTQPSLISLFISSSVPWLASLVIPSSILDRKSVV